MSIVTRTGDAGETALMFNRRVPKTDPRVEAYGTVDELNAALGAARAAAAANAQVASALLHIQRDLVILMGELAVATEDRTRYEKTGRTFVSAAMTHRLEALIGDLEQNQRISYEGWATPGANAASAALDVARTVCRRAERRAASLDAAGCLPNGEILRYLNRLSDLCWLFARLLETAPSPSSP